MKFFITFLFFSTVTTHATTCEDWFLNRRISPGKDCVQKCLLLPTGMGDWECTSQCQKLCSSKSLLEKTLGQLAYYPGLTIKERDLITKKPYEAITVFLQKQKAEGMTLSKFGRDGDGDESDAYRHFIWAALMSKELGPDTAKEFLDAHESNQSSI